MKRLLPLITAATLGACSIAPPSNAPLTLVPDNETLDSRIETLMTEQDVKGLAIAVINGNQISHLRTFGYRNVENQLPLETDTIMYGASLTKAAFSYMVMQLVDEGLIDLDRSIADYLPEPLTVYEGWATLEGDEDWRKLTPRIILTHSTGIHNLWFLEPDHDLQFHFEPGTHYAYSGEGFRILHTVLEEGLGLNVKEEMQTRVFDRFDMPNTSMQWREDFAANLADGYAMDNSFEPHDERSNVSASGSMDTTIADQARMWRGMLNGEGLSDASREEWIAPNIAIRTAQKFPTIENYDTFDPRGESISLSAGLGVETWEGSAGRTFAKGGHNDWTGNIVICQDERKRCVVLLSNSVRAEIIYPEIVDMVLGDTGYPWWWVYPDLHD